MNLEELKKLLNGKKTNITAVGGFLAAGGDVVFKIVKWIDGDIDFDQLINGLQGDSTIFWIALLFIFMRIGVNKLNPAAPNSTTEEKK